MQERMRCFTNQNTTTGDNCYLIYFYGKQTLNKKERRKRKLTLRKGHAIVDETAVVRDCIGL